MESTRARMEYLLRQSIDDTATVTEISPPPGLSPYLAGSLSYYQAAALGEEFLLVAPADEEDEPSLVRSRIEQVSKVCDLPVVAVLAPLNPTQRRMLIETGQSFITERGDLYLPHLALLLRQEVPHRAVVRRRFRPSDKLVFLFGLYAETPFEQQEVADATGVSVGSVSRALSNLCSLGMLDFETAGRTGRLKRYMVREAENYYRLGSELFGEAVWSTALTMELPQDVPCFASGLTALAETSNLVGPSRSVYAIGPNDASAIRLSGRDPYGDFAYIVQVLNYNPAPFASDGRVDPFTMIKTLGAREDERVSIALREALGGYPWFQG